jgi:hypothetical protein
MPQGCQNSRPILGVHRNYERPQVMCPFRQRHVREVRFGLKTGVAQRV